MTIATNIAMTTFHFDRGSAVPYYKQIYDGYRTAILSGRLRPGERLPSTRALAAELGISRLPAVNAFEQLLHEGYIEGRAGSGTFVRESIPDELSEVAGASQPRVGRTSIRTSISSSIRSEPARLGPLRVSLPALDKFPLRLWSRLVTRHVKQLTVEQMAYGDPAGYGPLRVAVADYLRTARAVRCEAEQVLIVSGSQMALRICAEVLLGRGVACVEEPGYPGAREALGRGGARVVPIPVDGEGIDVDTLARLGRRVRAVYVTPSHQYPLGMSMTLSRRLALLEWARRSDAWIIEDDYDSEYRYASRPLGALQGIDTASRVIYIGTFSRVLFPSLRLGYMVVPPDLASGFLRNRESIDLFSPVLEQVVLAEFLREGHFVRHVRRMRALYEKRRDALIRGLREHAGGLVPHNTDAGLHVTTFLPPGIDDRVVIREAAERGLDATALSTCYAGIPRNGLVLGFGGSSERRILAACKVLGEVIFGRA
jgi:GntR family transcriptional regulator/MocR family aminotransferase